MNEALLADRVVVMNEGHLLADGKPYDVFKNVELIKSVGLDAPQQFDLIDELRLRGHKIASPKSLNIDDCAQAIYDYYKLNSKD